MRDGDVSCTGLRLNLVWSRDINGRNVKRKQERKFEGNTRSTRRNFESAIMAGNISTSEPDPPLVNGSTTLEVGGDAD